MRVDADLWNRFFLADHLGVPVATINAMSVDDFNGHLAFLRVKAERSDDG